MQITDTIADMLTRIRNAGRAGHETCDIPASRMKQRIADILLEEGYIRRVSRSLRATRGYDWDSRPR